MLNNNTVLKKYKVKSHQIALWRWKGQTYKGQTYKGQTYKGQTYNLQTYNLQIKYTLLITSDIFQKQHHNQIANIFFFNI